MGPVDMRVQPGAGLELEHLGRHIKSPDAGKRSVQVLNQGLRAPLQHVCQLVGLGQYRAHRRAHRHETYAFGQLVLGLLSRGDVAEDEDSPGDLSVSVADGRGTVVDGPLGAVPGDQDRVVGQPHDHTLPQCSEGRVLDLRAGLLVDDLENRFQRLALGFLLCPARQVLRYGVQEADVGLSVRGDHCIADAGQRCAEPLALFVKNCGCLLAGHDRTMDQPDHRGDETEPKQSGHDAVPDGRFIRTTGSDAPQGEKILLMPLHLADQRSDDVHLCLGHTGEQGLLSVFLVLAALFDHLIHSSKPGGGQLRQTGHPILLRRVVSGLILQCREQPIEPLHGSGVRLEEFLPTRQRESSLSGFGIDERQQHLACQVEHLVRVSDPAGILVEHAGVAIGQRSNGDQQSRE